jgi:hypothetical protein
MRTRAFPRICVALIAVAIGAQVAPAQKRKASAPVELATHGKKLEARYAKELEALRAGIRRALPKVGERKRSAYLAARTAEKTAEAKLQAAQKALGEVKTAQALVNHAKGKWIGGADKGIAKAKQQLKKATTGAERKAAQKELAKWRDNRKDGVQALGERQAVLDKARRKEPKMRRALEAAEAAVTRSKTKTMAAVKGLSLRSFLSRDGLDARLAKFVVLLEATPRGLAVFAQQGRAQEKLLVKMLADRGLMLQMVTADGAQKGNYGRAMEIYEAIRKASPRARKGPLQRLALAIGLEHAVPVSQRNPKAAANAPATVDPVARYLHYEKAFLGSELDPGFRGLSVWDYRMVVNGSEPDHTLAWGREMLRSYRPDHVYTADARWRYVALVRTDIRYGSQDNKHDRSELQFFQNILMNGGVCGRRAFIGRFTLRAFGVPTTARPQRGHAALAHRTPDGWVVCLGGGWGSGWTKTRYDRDLDFLATTQAREDRSAYLRVKRAQWIGDVVGEKRVFGFLRGNPDFWYGLSLYLQRGIIAERKAVTLAAVGEELGEANESKVKYAIEAATVTGADRRIVVDTEGVITIPAVACSKPTKSTGKIIFMPSNLGGKQLHYSRTGRAQGFEYGFDAPAAGKYALTARVVTPSWKQHLLISANAKEPVDMALPHTVGLWSVTEPVEVELVEGRNVLRITHKGEGYAKGFTIRDFTLSPLK